MFRFSEHSRTHVLIAHDIVAIRWVLALCALPAFIVARGNMKTTRHFYYEIAVQLAYNIDLPGETAFPAGPGPGDRWERRRRRELEHHTKYLSEPKIPGPTGQESMVGRCAVELTFRDCVPIFLGVMWAKAEFLVHEIGRSGIGA
jgi:hypothetical protein